MRRLVALISILLVSACGAPDWPEPAPDAGQLVIRFEARPRAGTESSVNARRSHYAYSPGYETVNYRSLRGIAASLVGDGLGDGGSLATTVEYDVGRSGRRSVLLAPAGGTLLIRNRGSEEVDVFGMADDGDFDVTVPARGESRVTLPMAGEYEINDSLDSPPVKLLVLDHRWGVTARAGSSRLLDGIPPGRFTLRVDAPRLPVSRIPVVIEAGRRTEITVTLGVGPLGDR